MFEILLALLAIIVMPLAVLGGVMLYLGWQQSSEPDHITRTDLVTKLKTARSRLGLIANRESISEARKIANKAIKEIDHV